MRTLVPSPEVEDVTEVWASTETKAIDSAGLRAARFGLAVNVHPDLGEYDGAVAGFLPPNEFEPSQAHSLRGLSESVRA
jgi:hypothetical protein